jgi:hypothetical protein
VARIFDRARIGFDHARMQFDDVGSGRAAQLEPCAGDAAAVRRGAAFMMTRTAEAIAHRIGGVVQRHAFRRASPLGRFPTLVIDDAARGLAQIKLH